MGAVVLRALPGCGEWLHAGSLITTDIDDGDPTESRFRAARQERQCAFVPTNLCFCLPKEKAARVAASFRVNIDSQNRLPICQTRERISPPRGDRRDRMARVDARMRQRAARLFRLAKVFWYAKLWGIHEASSLGSPPVLCQQRRAFFYVLCDYSAYVQILKDEST